MCGLALICLMTPLSSAALPPGSVDISSAGLWKPEAGWLGNPGTGHVVTSGERLRFSVAPPGQGMKWRHALVQPVSTQERPFLTVRYRARGLTRGSDYFIHLGGQTGGTTPREFDAIPLSAVIDDEAWHQLSVQVSAMQVTMLAIQVQAASADTFVEIASIRFSADKPRIRLADYLDIRPGGPPAAGYRPISFATNGSAKPWLVAIGIDPGEFNQPRIVVESVPFDLHAPDLQVLATALEGQGETAIELDSSAQAIYLLMGAQFAGQESPSIGAGPLVQVRQVERFVVRVEYADGISDLIFPAKFPGGSHSITQEPAVYVIQPTRPGAIRRLHLSDGMRQGRFLLMGVTIGPPPRPTASGPSAPSPAPLASVPSLPPNAITTESAALALSSQQQAVALINRATGSSWLAGPSRLYSITPADKLQAQLTAKPLAGGEIELTLELVNTGREPVAVTITFPMLTGLTPGGDPKDLVYCFPRRGCAISSSQADLRDPYSGRFPLQFMDVCHPRAGGWYLMVHDTSNTPKTYWLKKNAGIDLGVDYWPTTLQPGQRWTLPPAVLGAHRGDWHEALHAYRRWLAGWYRPLVVRKQWFKEVFNFRQHFMHLAMPRPSGIFDPVSKRLDLATVVQADAGKFGGIDYLHLFDWGYAPEHGYRGDYDPWQYLGGLGKFTSQLRQVEDLGIPVGLYFEGYLVDPQSDVGKSHGRAWQMLKADGSSCSLFPPCMNMCPHVPAWQDYLVGVYDRVARETGARGYYIDEFGNASLYICHNPNHGHQVPISSLQGEMTLTRGIRQVIPPDAVLYTEDTPTDVTSQYQDGSFTYAIACTIECLSPIPLNLTRFALPDFKTFEIIACDAPLRDDQQAVKRVFFNGEGIWLEGLADDWFTPETRALIARTHRILRDHRPAFTTLTPEPFVPAGHPDVRANRFASPGESVWTLYNGAYQTVRGPLLTVDHLPGATYRDAWNERPIAPLITGNQAVIPLELGPRDVGCVVQLSPLPGGN